LIISVVTYMIKMYHYCSFSVMSKKRSWSDEDLRQAVTQSFSIRQVLSRLGLVESGGNYQHVKRIIRELNYDTAHFLGRGWSVGMKFQFRPKIPLEDIMVENSIYQSYKLKKRLFEAGLRKPHCELCGWSQKSKDGRVPLELDHINGNHTDNRLANLRILCPNCHSLQTTHRGINKVKYPKR